MGTDVRQIRIGKYDFGIIGMTDAILSVAEKHKDAADNVISEALLQILSKDNYISDNVREGYKQAFLREYKKHFNLPMPVLNDADDELVVTIAGPGCPSCEKLEMEVMMALSELALPARVEHLRDLKEIAQKGIFGTPALIINKVVKCVGSAPSKSQLIAWLSPYKKTS